MSGKIKYIDLVDVEKLQDTMDLFYKVTGFPNAILDPDENVLVAAGWTDICMKYHRCHPELQKCCKQSDAYIKTHLSERRQVVYQCKNGLWDAAFPLMIGDEHLATFFFGQFFYEDSPPDTDFFRRQAEYAGFDEEEYLDALKKVPILSREKVNDILAYYKDIATQLTEMGLKNLQLKTEIAERKKVKRKLAKSEKNYRQLVEKAGSIILRWDTKGTIQFINSYGLRFFGYAEIELIGRSVIGTIVPESDSTGRDLKEMILAITTNPEKYEFNQNENITRDGARVWIEWTNQPVCNSKGMLKEILSIGIDITKRKQAETELEKKVAALQCSDEKINNENALKKSILESPQDIVIFALDRNYKYTTFNQNHKNTMKQIWGVDIEIGMNILDVILKKSDRIKAKDNFDRALNGEQFTIVEAYGSEELARRYYENNYNPIKDKNGSVIGLTVFLTNVTEREQLANERAKAVKLESIGVLAGGIAHDFNNMLTAVIGNLSLANIYAENNIDLAKEVIAEAENACLRAKGLANQLLTFAKGGEPIKRSIDISDLIRNSASFALRGSNSKCTLDIQQDIWTVEADENQLNQVLNNIIINADQAMPGGGKIWIRSTNCEVGPESMLPLCQGKYIKIEIRDQGHGIPPNILPKIFDPYFSTKQKGNGLGLATSYSIIKKHKGHISAKSEPNEGATFIIFLPASEKTLEVCRAEPLDNTLMCGRILLMDDDTGVKNVVVQMLELLGNSVESVADGVRAVELYKEALDNNRPFDAVILDLTIPGGMGGLETIKQLREINPDVRAIVSSGYSNAPVLANPQNYGFLGIVNKPFRITEIKSVLQQVLTSK